MLTQAQHDGWTDELYENEHFPIEAPDPVFAIKFRMEQEGLQIPADVLLGASVV